MVLMQLIIYTEIYGVGADIWLFIITIIYFRKLKVEITITVYVLFINVQNFRCHIFIKCHTTTDTPVHCVLKHQSLIVFLQECRYSLVCPLGGCLCPCFQVLGHLHLIV